MSMDTVYQNDSVEHNKNLNFSIIYLFEKNTDDRGMIPMKREDVRRSNARRLAEDIGGFTEFAARTGMDASQVSQIIGKNPKKNIGNIIAKRIEEAFALPAGSLDIPPMNADAGHVNQSNDDDDEPLRFDEPLGIPGARRVEVLDESSPYLIQIPKVKLRLQAGITGFQMDPDLLDGGRTGIPRAWANRKRYDPRHLIAIDVEGESMEPTFYEGDTVVINTNDRMPSDNAVFAINYDGQAVIKRFLKRGGVWWLTSDNEDQDKFRPMRCEGVRCLVIGRVVRREGDNF